MGAFTIDIVHVLADRCVISYLIVPERVSSGYCRQDRVPPPRKRGNIAFRVAANHLQDLV